MKMWQVLYGGPQVQCSSAVHIAALLSLCFILCREHFFSAEDLFLALLYATAQQSTVVTRASVVLPSSVRPSVRPSVKPVFPETVKRINAKFWEKLPVHHMSRTFFFQNVKFWIFANFFVVFVNMGPYASKSFRRHLLWKNTPNLLPKIHVYSWRGSLPKMLK